MSNVTGTELQQFKDMAVSDDTAAALLVLANAVNRVADSIDRLGNADAMTPMGAIESLGKVISDGLASIAESLDHQV